MSAQVPSALCRATRRVLQALSGYSHYAITSSLAPIGRLQVSSVGPIAGEFLRPVRGFSEELRVLASSLSEGEYHHVADEALESLVERLEAYVEENDVDGGDVEYSQGVLTVKLGRLGTFVVNKQTPNRQIWLSSPVSGPFRFDFAEGRWIYNRDGRDLVRQLEQEIGGLVGAKLQLE